MQAKVAATPNANLPADWKIEQMSAVADINPESLTSKTPADFRFRYIDISAVSRGVIDWGQVSEIEFSSAPSRARRIVRQNDILLCTVRPGLQSHAFADWDGDNPTICSTGFAIVRCRPVALPRYVYHLIFGQGVSSELHRLECGTGYPAVNESDVEVVKAPVPPLAEQHTIARILDSADEAIERTRKAITTAERLKRGLMQELLHPAGGPQPAPTNWTRLQLRRVGEWNSGGTPRIDNRSYWGGAIPWLSPKDMKQFDIYDTIDHITELGAREGSRLMDAGTIFIVVRGMILAHSFPVCISHTMMAFNQDVKAIRCSDGIDARFMAYWLDASKAAVLNMVTDTSHGTKRLDLRQIWRLSVCAPDVIEQRRIVRVIDAADSKVSHYQARLRHLERLKRGLMQDLLTGRVRVKLPAAGDRAVARSRT